MLKKKINPSLNEQREFRVFNPEDIKQTIEIPVKPAPKPEELETIEVVGNKKVKKTRKITKTTKTTGVKTKKVSAKDGDDIEEDIDDDLNADKSAKAKTIKLNPKGYILIITEKPQAAGKIAAALSNGNERKKSEGGVPYYELERNGKRIVVACAVGHLYTVSQTRKGSDYPIFDIAWFPNFEIKKKDFSKRYYFAIKKLVKNASEIVIATDFDIEGEVIGYNIVRFVAGQKDAKRMKYSSLTAKELQDSYDNANPTIEWGQAIAGETRHFIDWLYGINLSRALMDSIKSTGKFKIMSIGRVQGPTLNLIVQKEKEILSFKPTPYWQVFITINDGKNKLELKYIRDIIKKSELDKFKDLEGKKVIAKTTKKKETISPPAPFDLTSLQTEVYHNHSINPAQTLQIAQKLYLAGLISYPRTSSQKIPEAMAPRKIIEQLSKFFKETSYAVRKAPVEGKKSDPAHPAIIPTGIYEKLDGDDEKVYNLIVKRFISCFCNNAEIENKRVEAEINGLKFNEKGMEVLEQGWMKVYPSKMNEKEIKDFDGEVNIDKVKTEEKVTQPPRRYSPASIISELEKRNLGTKCLTEDTNIIFNGKIIAIKELFNKGKYISKENGIEIKEINGVTVSLNEKDNPIYSFPKLISKRKLNEKEKVINIESDLSTIKLTQDHLLYIYDNKKIKTLKVSDINLNHNLIGITKNNKEGEILIKKNIFGNNYKIVNNEIRHKFSSKIAKGILLSKFPIRWSDSLAWILGYYYGDGSYSEPKYNGSHQLYFTTTEKKALDLIKVNIKYIFGIEPYSYDLNGKYKVNCNCVMSYALIKLFPELNKKIPIQIPKEFIGSFLKGFFDADGNVHLRPLTKTSIKGKECNSFNTPRIKITLSNYKLIVWVSELLKSLGINNNINKNISKCKGKVFDCWTILISGRDKVESFAYKIGFDSYKEDILYKGLKCNSNQYKAMQNGTKICLHLFKKNLNNKEISKITGFKNYERVMALRRLFNLGIISKKRYSQANNHVYSLNFNSLNYLNHCIKMNYEKIDNNIYLIPIKKIEKIAYNKEVYDISVNPESPNFIVQGNILVHNSTRANIIETLYDRNYVQGKSIQATELGIKLIDSLRKHSPIIIDEHLTREMEKDMENIRSSKKELDKKENATLKKAEDILIKISKDFKKNEKEIGKDLVSANEDMWKQQNENNKLGVTCPQCKKGELLIKFSPRFKNYFVACTSYPDCKKTFSLSSHALIKKLDDNKKCEYCQWPMLISIKKGKRPWIFCFNPLCESKKELDINGNTKNGK